MIIQSSHHQQESIPEQRASVRHIFGGLKITYLLYVFIPPLILVCFFCYYMAVHYKEQKPYPHATITNTACHYPQDIFFRFIMLPSAGFIHLVYFTMYKWLESQKKRISYPVNIHPILLPLAQISVWGFLAAIGTIDAKGYPAIHSIGAIFFFIVLFILAMYLTLVAKDMREWDTTFCSRKSILLKLIVAGYTFGVALYCLYLLILRADEENDDDPIVVIIEWNLVFGGLLWLFTFVFDWKHVYVTLKGDLNLTIKKIPLQNIQ